MPTQYVLDKCSGIKAKRTQQAAELLASLPLRDLQLAQGGELLWAGKCT
jgi:hypothetical protein